MHYLQKEKFGHSPIEDEVDFAKRLGVPALFERVMANSEQIIVEECRLEGRPSSQTLRARKRRMDAKL